MRRKLAVIAGVIACALAVYLVAREDHPPPHGDPALSGDRDATVFDVTADAFAQSAPKLSDLDRRAFAVGNSFFNRNWATAPASTSGDIVRALSPAASYARWCCRLRGSATARAARRRGL